MSEGPEVKHMLIKFLIIPNIHIETFASKALSYLHFEICKRRIS